MVFFLFLRSRYKFFFHLFIIIRFELVDEVWNEQFWLVGLSIFFFFYSHFIIIIIIVLQHFIATLDTAVTKLCANGFAIAVKNWNRICIHFNGPTQSYVYYIYIILFIILLRSRDAYYRYLSFAYSSSLNASSIPKWAWSWKYLTLNKGKCTSDKHLSIYT